MKLNAKLNTKFLSLLLAVLLFMGVLAGCGGSDEEPSSDSSVSSSTSRSESSSSSSAIEYKGERETGKPTEPPKEIAEKIAELKELNSDTAGWVVADGADCSEGVLFRDNAYYQRKGYDKKYSWLGAIFFDEDMQLGDYTREGLSRNIIVYGHNVDDDREDGKMFAKLINYDDPAYAKEHPYIWLYTENDAMLFYIFAAFRTEASDWYIYPDQTDEEFEAVIAEALLRSEILTDDIDVTPEDKIITLATCTDQFDKNWTQRWAVMGRLARAGEDQGMEIEYKKNPEPKKPAND